MSSSVLGYRSESALTAYPFKDMSTLASSLPPYRAMSNRVLLDATVITTVSYVRHACLETLTRYGDNLLVRLHLFNEAKEQPAEDSDKLILTFEIPVGTFDPLGGFWGGSIDDGQDVTGVRLQFGPDVNRVISEGQSYVFTTWLNSGQGRPAAELLESCLVVPAAPLSGMKLANAGASIGSTPTTLITVSPSIKIAGGYNVDVDTSDTEAGLTIGAGLGLGLYDPCADGVLGISSINEVGPDASGRFIFNSGSCHTISYPTAHTIQFAHNCSPKCGEEQLKEFVHYWNRLNDATKRLAGYGANNVDSVQSLLLARMNDYRTKISSLTANKAPFVEAQYASSTVAGKRFVSVAVGVYDPNGQDRKVTFDVLPEAGVTWAYQANTAFLKEGNQLYPLPFTGSAASWKFPDRSINCKGSAIVEFVLSTADTLTNKTLGFQLKEAASVARPATSFNMMNVAPDGLHYNLRSRRVWNTEQSKYDYTFSLDLIDAQFDPDNPTKATDIVVTLPAGLSMTSGSARLNLNNGETVTALSNTLNYTGLSINYAQKATLTFGATFTPSGGNDHSASFSVSGTVTHSGGSYTKAVTLK